MVERLRKTLLTIGAIALIAGLALYALFRFYTSVGDDDDSPLKDGSELTSD